MKVIQIFVTNLFQNGQIPFFQLSHSSLIPLSTLFILPIPNYKLPKAICNAIISDRQVLAPSPPLVQLWFDFAKWKQVPEATWLLSVFQCELRARPDVTFYWRNRYRYNIAELCLTLCRKSSSSLRNIKAKGGPWPLESNTSSIFSSPNNRGGNRFPCDRDIYIYILRESCRLERIYLSQFGRPQPPKVPVLSVGANVTNFLENFLDFPRTSLFHWWLRFSGGGRCLDSRNCGFNFVVSRNNFFIFFHSLFRDEI